MTGKAITIISQLLVQILMYVGLQLCYLWQMRLAIFTLLFLWARILYMVHGTRLLLVPKCSAECPLAASKVTVSLQLPSENGSYFSASVVV